MVLIFHIFQRTCVFGIILWQDLWRRLLWLFGRIRIRIDVLGTICRSFFRRQQLLLSCGMVVVITIRRGWGHDERECAAMHIVPPQQEQCKNWAETGWWIKRLKATTSEEIFPYPWIKKSLLQQLTLFSLLRWSLVKKGHQYYYYYRYHHQHYRQQ